MSDWTGPFPSDEEIAQRWTPDSISRASASWGMPGPALRRLFAFGDDDDPSPTGGVQVVVVDLNDVRERQAEMDALLGD